MPQMRFWPGLIRPAGGVQDAPPDPVGGWGGEVPNPHGPHHSPTPGRLRLVLGTSIVL